MERYCGDEMTEPEAERKYDGNNEAVDICDADSDQRKVGQVMMKSKKSQNER